MEDKLDQYLRDTAKQLKSSRQKKNRVSKPERSRNTAFKRWASSAAMDLFKFYIPLIIFGVAGGIFLIVEISIAKYCFYAFGIVVLAGIAFCAFDFHRFQTWSANLPFAFDGWNQIVHSRSSKYWDMNGEHWVPVKIVVVMREPVTEKHFRVVEAFMKKLRRRLNQWTVSEDPPIGSSQPKGWSHDGLVIAGEMNPRVLNLIRKRFSGELTQLCRHMPNAVNSVMIEQTGQEKYYHVVMDTSD
jgi:hypothetical protein